MRLCAGVAAVILMAGVCMAADWPQWRGPGRDGIVPGDEKIAATWPVAGPAKLWEYPAPTHKTGGLGSPVVVAGRVYALLSNQTLKPVPTRAFTVEALQQVGWFEGKLPDELAAKVEEARVSDALKALKGDPRNKWIDQWVKQNLTKADDPLVPAVQDRLNRGPAAFPLPELSKLTPLKGKTFQTEEQLDKWIADAGLAPEVAAAVNNASIKTKKLSDDWLVCLEATTGHEIWKKSYVGNPMDWGICGTPTVADGRIYAVLSDGQAYCWKTDDGQELWKQKLALTHSSFLIAGNLAIIPASELTALDLQDGHTVWKCRQVKTTSSSPILWESGDSKYLLCNTEGKLHAVGLADGKDLWSVAGGLYSTAVLSGDTMVVLTNAEKDGLAAYRLSAGEPERLWAAAFHDRGGSPIIHDGYVYAVGIGKAVCVELKTGQVEWNLNVGGGEISSPVLAGNQIISPVGNGNLVMLTASPEKGEIVGRARLTGAPCASPAISDGKMFLRLENALACYDLR